MKAKLLLVNLILSWLTVSIASAAIPRNQRVIYTSGKKVYTIYFQLGDSTILHFTTNPQTVICGNKNYFNIEKIKNAITIQPLANLSTNLTVLNKNHHYLFYLTPAMGRSPDGFIEVKWVPESLIHSLKRIKSPKERTVILDRAVWLSKGVRFTVDREIWLPSGIRIFEMTVKDLGAKSLNLKQFKLSVGAEHGKEALGETIWKIPSCQPNQTVSGRLILRAGEPRPIAIALKVGFESHKIPLGFKSL